MTSRRSALVVFDASSSRPIIVCIQEDALPANPGEAWLILARDSDILDGGSKLSPERAEEHADDESVRKRPPA